MQGSFNKCFSYLSFLQALQQVLGFLLQLNARLRPPGLARRVPHIHLCTPFVAILAASLVAGP